MASKKIKPKLLFAGGDGNIYDHPELLMLVRRGGEFALPRPDELIPLPPESELFLLPGRRSMGLDPETGRVEVMEESAVAAFICPGYTLSAVAAYKTDIDSCNTPTLPLFSYAAAGYAQGRIWICASKVDDDPRQVFGNVSKKRIKKGAQQWLKQFPENRLVQHLMHCALTSCCPAARNLCLGRFEAPLPTARTCNADCVGCISQQPAESGFPATQSRIAFTPSPEELVEIMQTHGGKESKPVFSFGQGCEGEPMTEAPRIAEAVRMFRAQGGRGTVNINTNASLPTHIPTLAEVGMSSMRVSLNSVRAPLYNAYYRPKGYSFNDVRHSIRQAKELGMFVSLNFLFFPGVSDTEEEFEALSSLIEETKLDFIQLRNLNLDPELYMGLVDSAFATAHSAPAMGLKNFRKRLRKSFEHLQFGYFNPYLDK